MDLKYLEQLASKNDPMPKYLNQPEQFYYLSMRSLYNEYRRSYISKDQACSDRKLIIQKFNENVEKQNIALKDHQYIDHIRVAFGGQFKAVKESGCPVCRRLIEILDGRNLSEGQDT